MAVSKRLRFEILRRDNHTCRYCGRGSPDVVLTIDHVVPVALGGSDEPTNLVAACDSCNSGKSSSSPDSNVVQDVAADALRWAAAMRQAAVLEDQTREAIERRDHVFSAMWDYYCSINQCRRHPFPDNWSTTISSLIGAGLSLENDVYLAVETAFKTKSVLDENKWRYFCGIAWGKVRRRQDVARKLIERGDV